MDFPDALHGPGAEVLADPKRLAALEATGLFTTERDEAFDRLTRLAARILHAPVATLSLVDDRRQFLKSSLGLPEPWASTHEIGLDRSICKHVVITGQPLLIDDLRFHPAHKTNPSIHAAGVISYAGVPLRCATGEILGCLTVTDVRARTWTDEELGLLQDIAGSVMTEIDMRTDIRRRERMEAELRFSEERFRTIVEAASDIIYDTDEWGRFTYVNPVAERLMGLPREQLVGMHFTELVRSDLRSEVESFYRKQFVGRVENTYYEFPAVSAAGAQLWIGQNVRLLLHENGRIRGAQAIARDMTARREIETMKDQFISMVSHELRTPLTGIRGSLGLLATGKVPPDKMQRMVDIAVESTDRLIGLINDILDLEQVSSGAIELDLSMHDLAEIAARSVDALKSMAEQAGVRIQLDNQPVALQVDANRILQVAINLISNAVKFSPANSMVRVATREEGATGLLEVSDQGPGIPVHEQSAIFNRFHQLDSSDTRDKGGTGLGLAICKSLVELHGGTIEVQSVLGAGTTFRVRLPRPASRH